MTAHRLPYSNIPTDTLAFVLPVWPKTVSKLYAPRAFGRKFNSIWVSQFNDAKLIYIIRWFVVYCILISFDSDLCFEIWNNEIQPNRTELNTTGLQIYVSILPVLYNEALETIFISLFASSVFTVHVHTIFQNWTQNTSDAKKERKRL